MEEPEDKLLLAYYGDDFTGSTDVLESLTVAGVQTVLFVEPPQAEQFKRFADVRAVGIAGNSRAMSPAEMDVHLPAALESLAKLRPRFLHYKTCSTFDSSPAIGSIGHAIDLGVEVCRNRCVPLVVGVPVLRRYCVFGNLFASSGLDSPVYRLDRHPTMSQHPITPMDEANLLRHLSQQTKRRGTLVDLTELAQGFDFAKAKIENLLSDDCPLVLLDVLSLSDQATVGQLLTTLQSEEQRSLFVVGSSGVEDALSHSWNKAHEPKAFPPLEPVEQTCIVSGSCSPVTEGQIEFATQHGFEEIAVDTVKATSAETTDRESDRVVHLSLTALRGGKSPLWHTSRGPKDARLHTQLDAGEGSISLGTFLGAALRRLLEEHPLPRITVAGGDTSGEVARSLGIEALTMHAPFAPGAPICRVYAAADSPVEGMQISFKGGQVGLPSFFVDLLAKT